MEQFVELSGLLHDLNAFASPAVNGLDEHRVADALRHGSSLLGVGQDAVTAGHHRHVETHGGADGVGLVAHGFHAGHRRADEVETVGPDELSELGVLR